MLKALPARSKSQGDVIHPETPVVHEQLWVDKYAPNSFTELLSDELTNREVSIFVLMFSQNLLWELMLQKAHMFL